MGDKRGQSMSTSTIILLILGLVVLVVLILGFMSGWKVFKGNIQPTNVDDIVESCQVACGLGKTYEFCSSTKVLRANDDNLEVASSCAVFATVPEFSKYGISTCASVTCDLSCEDIVIDNLKGDKTLTSGYNVSALAGENCFVPKSK
ncbi:hypothetical protein B6U91_01730 [Candidatus Pacearchaeota archaeon ex4484_71]|nr:MAG: hypothetical protein B6U91_01730 [Candidatus Pacearchaeota archaeon ex4484_71]